MLNSHAVVRRGTPFLQDGASGCQNLDDSMKDLPLLRFAIVLEAMYELGHLFAVITSFAGRKHRLHSLQIFLHIVQEVPGAKGVVDILPVLLSAQRDSDAFGLGAARKLIVRIIGIAVNFET